MKFMKNLLQKEDGTKTGLGKALGGAIRTAGNTALGAVGLGGIKLPEGLSFPKISPRAGSPGEANAQKAVAEIINSGAADKQTLIDKAVLKAIEADSTDERNPISEPHLLSYADRLAASDAGKGGEKDRDRPSTRKPSMEPSDSAAGEKVKGFFTKVWETVSSPGFWILLVSIIITCGVGFMFFPQIKNFFLGGGMGRTYRRASGGYRRSYSGGGYRRKTSYRRRR